MSKVAPVFASPERWWAQVFENSTIGMAVAVVDNRFLFVNPAFREMTGDSEAELRALKPLEHVVEADRSATRIGLSRLAMGLDRQFQAEKRYRRKDGNLLWVRATVSLIPVAPPAPTYVLIVSEDISQHPPAVKAPGNQKEVLQQIFDHIPLMIMLTGADGSLKLLNREVAHKLGWTLDDMEGRGIDFFVECNPDPRKHREVVAFLAAAQGEWADFRLCRRDGGTLDTMWTAVRLPDATTLGIGLEITERKRMEQALRDSEQTLRQLTEHISEVFWVIDPKAERPVYVSPAYERIWGRTCESLHQDPRLFIEAIHPEDRSRVLEALEAQNGSQIPFDIHYRVIRPDSSVRWIWDRSFPVRDAAGEVYRFVGLAADITERKRSEEDLRRSETYLKESERLSHIGTWALTVPSREISFWSAEHYRIFGFDPADGPPSLEAALARIHPEDRAVVEAISQTFGKAQAFEVDYRIVLPGGAVRYLHSVGHPLLNDAGELVEFIGMAMDVTEHKLAEDALQRSLEKLRALAARVEKVREEERTRLAREIHDELGQGLTGIKIDLRFLTDYPQGRQEQVRRLQAILKRVDDTIQSVRKIATVLRPGILDDLGLVAAAEWAAREFAARTGLKCTLSLPREDLPIEPEVATALFRILQESLTNIARHAEATEFSVRLTEEDGLLCLEIRDNGQGFRKTGTSPGDSLGILGMKERAFLLGGRLSIDSSPGQGATVTAWMPWRRNAGGAGD